jgi:ABC-type glycerol-3-phosphate transport system substrate-binding protein
MFTLRKIPIWLALAAMLMLIVACATPTVAPTAAPPTAAPTKPPEATKPPATSAPVATSAPAATKPPEATKPAPTTAAVTKPVAPVATAASRANLKGEVVINTWRDIGADPKHPNYTLHLLYKEWEKNHPGVTVKYQPMLGTVVELFGYITTNLRSKTLADGVMQVFPSPAQLDPDLQYDFSADLAKQNPYSANKTWREDFPLNAVALNDVTVKDKVLMVGTTFVGDLGDTAILYNQEWLDKAGIKALPKTWTEFFDALAKLKAAGAQPWYMPMAGNEAYIFTWYQNILADQLYDDIIKECDGAAGDKKDNRISQMEISWCIKKGKLSSKHPGTTRMFEEMKKWSAYWHEGYQAPPPAGDPFVQGKVALRSIVRINMPFIENDPNVKFKWGSFYLPPLQGTARRVGNAGAGSGSQYMFIPKTTQDKGKLDLMLDLYQYVTAPKSLEYWCSLQTVPCYQPGSGIDKVFPGDPVMQERYRGFIEPPAVDNRVRGLDINNTYGQASTTNETKIFQDYLSGAMTLEQALAAYQRLFDQLADTAIRQHPEWNADKW